MKQLPPEIESTIGLASEVWAVIGLLIAKGIITDEEFCAAYDQSLAEHRAKALEMMEGMK